MSMTIHDFMELCQGAKGFVNVSIYKWTYANTSMITKELFDGVYSDMPKALSYELIKKWDVEMRNYRPYIVLYI